VPLAHADYIRLEYRWRLRAAVSAAGHRSPCGPEIFPEDPPFPQKSTKRLQDRCAGRKRVPARRGLFNHSFAAIWLSERFVVEPSLAV